MCALTGGSVDCCSGLSWRNCQGSSYVVTGKVIGVHSLLFLHFPVSLRLPILLHQHRRLQPPRHLRNPRPTLNLHVQLQEKSASVKERTMTLTTILPSIPEKGTMMTSTFPHGEDYRDARLLKLPACQRPPNAMRAGTSRLLCQPPPLRV